MLKSRPVAVAVFAMWTLLVWGNRISNVLRDAELEGSERTAALILPTIFVAIGVVAAVSIVAPVSERVARQLVGGAVGATVLVWLIRAPMIALADHDAAFIVVHVVLAVVSVLLGWWAWTSVSKWSACPADISDSDGASNTGDTAVTS